MYHILKAVILAQGFELKSILMKINNFWAEGNINENERKELIELAQENAHIKNEVDVLAKLEEMDKRIKALEDARGNTGNAGETYPEYVVGKWYYGGDIISFEGKNYICTAPEGQVCTWNPVEYPPYWNEH